MESDGLLRTGLIKRLEDLQKEYPVCNWLQGIKEMNDPDKIGRQTRINPRDFTKGTLYTYKSAK